MGTDTLQAAIVRRVRLHGPQSYGSLAAVLPVADSTAREALKALVRDGVLHLSALVYPDGRGRPSKLYGLVGVHPRAVTMADRVAGVLAIEETCSAADVAQALGVHVSTARSHLESMVARGRASRSTPRRVGNTGRASVRYGLVGAPRV